jgi:L-alanine-DL-glutamate epimerase-like enolase superfamily enzyme
MAWIRIIPASLTLLVEQRSASLPGADRHPRDDAARTRAVVKTVTDDAIVIADSNGGWSLLDARIAMNSMADLPVFIEQPCRTTEDCVLASRDSKLPLVLDESIVILSDVYEAKRSADVSSITSRSAGSAVLPAPR